MKKLKCTICGAPEDEVEHMVGVKYNPEDHGNKKDKALCNECITECHKLLLDIKFKKRVQEEVQTFLGKIHE